MRAMIANQSLHSRNLAPLLAYPHGCKSCIPRCFGVQLVLGSVLHSRVCGLFVWLCPTGRNTAL